MSSRRVVPDPAPIPPTAAELAQWRLWATMPIRHAIGHQSTLRLIAEVERLRTFSQWIMESECWGLDGGDVQDKALELGIIKAEPGGFDPERHHDATGCCEPGDTFYRVAWADEIEEPDHA